MGVIKHNRKRPHISVGGAAVAAASRLASMLVKKGASYRNKGHKKQKTGRKVSLPFGYTKNITKTKTKKKETNEEVHDSLVRRFKYVKLYSGKYRKHSVNKGCWKTNEVNQYFYDTPEGQQFIQVYAINNKSQILYSSGSGFDFRSQACESMFDTNPYQKTTGGQYYSGIVNPSDDRVKLHKIRYKLEIGNFTAGSPMAVDMYLIGVNRDNDITPDVWWNDCLFSQALGQNSALQQNSVASITPRVGYSNNTILDSRPFALPSWRKLFKVVDKRSVNLTSGGTYIQTWDLDFGGRVLEKEYLSGVTNLHFKGITYFVMIVSRGGLVLDSNNGSVSTSSGRLATLLTKQVVCSQVQANRVQAESSIVEIQTGSSVAQEKVVDVVDTVIQLSYAS